MPSHPIKILHILHAFTHGGLENGIVNIINGSPPDIEHDLCLLTHGGEFLQRIHRPIHCYELHKTSGNSLGIIAELARIIRRSGADIVHTRNWGAFDGVFAACFCPSVKVLHGEHGRDISDPLGLNRRRNLTRRLLSCRIAKFTAVSQDIGHWLTTTVKIPASKVAVIVNGVDTDKYRPHRDEGLRKELGLLPEDFVVGTIGRLDPVKNHAGLIRAFSIFAQKALNARLVIVGDGPERSALESLIADLSTKGTPILTGYRADIERFYGIFDVFVLNSFAEGMSNTLLEAMASGLPIICTPVGAASELITNGKQGIYVRPDDDEELIRVLLAYEANKDLRIDHGFEGRQQAMKNFSLISMVEKYCGLYRNILSI